MALPHQSLPTLDPGKSLLPFATLIWMELGPSHVPPFMLQMSSMGNDSLSMAVQLLGASHRLWAPGNVWIFIGFGEYSQQIWLWALSIVSHTAAFTYVPIKCRYSSDFIDFEPTWRVLILGEYSVQCADVSSSYGTTSLFTVPTDYVLRVHGNPFTPLPASDVVGARSLCALSSFHSHPIEEIWDLFFTCTESLGPNNRGLPSSDMRDLIFFLSLSLSCFLRSLISLEKKSGDADAAAASKSSWSTCRPSEFWPNIDNNFLKSLGTYSQNHFSDFQQLGMSRFENIAARARYSYMNNAWVSIKSS
ncbi:hypothetical protein C8R44DRAFT_750559 [Mycena epipterygia]|nr:hypothetical protein C8R44DRAFT_750559 [Mycena epipterygia]